jgi:hypothetical protein
MPPSTTTAPARGNGSRVELTAIAIPADNTFREAMLAGLVWVEEAGMGFSGQALRAPSIYDARYWANYEERALSPIAVALNQHRVDLVNRWVGPDAEVCDIGIGCGTFIETRGAHTLGYDVNPLGVEWLEARNLWMDPYAFRVPTVTFWDAIEHIHDPAALLANVERFAFISVPIFADARDVLASKHYKPQEHIWYWTRDGLIRWMARQGFDCVEHGTPESLIGRENIHSFVFRRR